MARSIPIQHIRQDSGFTLIELLVVIGISGILLMMLLPSVQAARESARCISCVSNMRQIGLAVVQYERIHNSYPPSNVAIEPFELHNVLTFLLPYVEQSRLYDRYDFNQPWYFNGTYYEGSDPVCCKNGYVSSNQIPVFQCPSAPAPDLVTYTVMPTGTYGTTDYAVCAEIGISGEARQLLLSSEVIKEDQRLLGILRPIYGNRPSVVDETLKASDVKDGASFTFLFTEDAGRPEYYSLDGRPSTAAAENFVTGAAWADRDTEYRISDACFGRLMNCHNENELFSFHPDRAVFAFADGSVRILHNDIDLAVFAALITPNGGETVEENQF